MATGGEKRTRRIAIIRENALILVKDKSLSREMIVEMLVLRAVRMGVSKSTAVDYVETAITQLNGGKVS